MSLSGRSLHKAALLAAFVLPLAVLSTDAGAFCIYNKIGKDSKYEHDKTIVVEQIGGGIGGKDFKGKIKPGEKKCCNWKDKGCNKSKKRTATLKFTIQGDDGKPNFNKSCEPVEIEAGGWIEVSPLPGNPFHHLQCKGFKAD